jgi:cytochrome P450
VPTLALDPLAAVTAADPYPYYARLVAERPFFRDDALGMWVAASAEAVEDVLTCAEMRVRPPSEPVPKAIADTPMAEIFSRWARMTDGRRQSTVKNAVVAALDRLDWNELAVTSARCAKLLAQPLSSGDRGDVEAFALGLAPLATATTLGFAQDDASRAVAWTRDFVRSIAPGSTRDEIARGTPATAALSTALLVEPHADGSLFAVLLDEGRRHGIEDAVIAANAIGFLFQSYDATAGLIGNTLVALARSGDLREAVRGDAALLERVIEEVARFDASVQNTRRFASADTTVMGSRVRAGEAVLVVLAAANRDPSVNPDPHRFDPAREERRTYTFGIGAHACPGARMATTIAGAGVAQLLEAGVDLQHLTAPGYRPSLNARVPTFASGLGAVS